MQKKTNKNSSFLQTSNFKLQRGFTLVELLVTVFIFSLITGAAIGIFSSAIKLQRYNLKHQQLIDQASYAIEYMSRAIRMAVKDDGDCIDSSNYLETADSIQFRTYHDQCWRFFLEGDQLKIDKNGTVYELSSSDFQVSSFTVSVDGDAPNDNRQPRVTISMDVSGTGSSPQPSIKLQTTISQRNLDI